MLPAAMLLLPMAPPGLDLSFSSLLHCTPAVVSLLVYLGAGLGYALVLAWFVGRTTALGRLSIACEAKHLVVFGVLWGLTAIGV